MFYISRKIAAILTIVLYADTSKAHVQPTPTQYVVIQQLDKVSTNIQQSRYFRHVPPDTFIRQLKERIINPYTLDQGKSVFCWLAAPLAYFYDKDPQGMSVAIINLYVNGQFKYFGNGVYQCLNPSQEAMDAVGTSDFDNAEQLKGKLVDQMVFLAFADHYKCWINIDRNYGPGDYNKSAWGGGTLGKEARLWADFGYGVEKHGFNILWLRPGKAELAKSALKLNETFVMYVNAPHFNQNMEKIKNIHRRPPYFKTGTHYVLVTRLETNKNEYQITFWDDDGIQHYTMPKELFQRCVYGVLKITRPQDEVYYANR